MKPKVAFHTLGCKLNFTETSSLGKQFLERGYEVTDFDSPSDVIILNTCSVTERADREARQWIRRALRKSPNAFVAVIGCYAQLEPEEIASIEGVDVVLGASEKFRLFDIVPQFEKYAHPKIFVSDISDATDFGPAFSSEVGNRTRAFLKVQDGCDFNCSFCTIPLARGDSRSQSIAATVLQAQYLVENGYKEIVLTGVNVGDYGKRDGSSFFALLQALENVNGIARFRISSIEPNLLTQEIIDFILSSEKFCNHFHIPLQSGSDTILRKMRRRYTANEYRNLLEYIKTKDENAGIGVDVIVGFPGETDELFTETYKFLTELPCSYLHVFTYSERPNTPANEFSEIIEPRIRFKRNEMLRNVSFKKRTAFYSRFAGSVMNVLIEHNPAEGGFSGLTTNYIRVNVNANESQINTIQPVLIEEMDAEHCNGVILAETFSPKKVVHQPTALHTFEVYQ
ncbi:MAG: tRNA (N(6)-L-threonylcarbamoyladenosine(37)-C(2))-methylthiotransferase MtaB [Bacteroidota bacterium]